jgi:electron-transferring-flavoprotein dehydrogenase
MPRLMNNHGNYIVSLGKVCRWLGQQAEALGVEIYPGFAAAEVLYNEDGSVKGVATGDMGVAKDGSTRTASRRAWNCTQVHAHRRRRARLACQAAHGQVRPARGSRSAEVRHWNQGTVAGRPGEPPPGLVVHTQGWPLSTRPGGGSFMYHLGRQPRVAIGFVVHLNYENPYLSPFDEFQRFKTHPAIAKYLKGGKRWSYGARAINEGGFQSVPKLTFPGGALIGCSAGFVNVPRIKGSHNAMKTGMLAAEAAFDAIGARPPATSSSPITTAYEAQGAGSIRICDKRAQREAR